jgi:hypothetical protein
MTSYLRFETTDDDVLIETDVAALAEPDLNTGEQKAGLGRWVRSQTGEVVAVAQIGFEQAVRKAVAINAQAFLAAVKSLKEPPAEMEITFGLKGTGEVGNVAVGKVAGESSYQVKMVWRRP